MLLGPLQVEQQRRIKSDLCMSHSAGGQTCFSVKSRPTNSLTFISLPQYILPSQHPSRLSLKLLSCNQARVSPTPHWDPDRQIHALMNSPAHDRCPDFPLISVSALSCATLQIFSVIAGYCAGVSGGVAGQTSV